MAKAQEELELANDMSDNKKGFFKYVNSKRRCKDIGPMLLVDGHLTNRAEIKAETFNAFFLPQSLIKLIDLGLPGLLSWRTTSLGTETFHLWTLKL